MEKRFGLVSLSCFPILAGSLCKRKSPECDRETSVCTDLDGVALCQCKSGYFQFNKMDHSCRGSHGSPAAPDAFLGQAGAAPALLAVSVLGVTLLN